MFGKWFTSRKASKVRSPRKAQLGVETLEDRTVPATLIGLTSTQRLLIFDSATPTITQQSPKITGLSTAGEILTSIDTRPASGVIYGLSSLNLLYTVDPSSAVATLVSTPPASFTLTGNNVGIDFNPTVDRLRIVSNADLNFRINPNNGAIVDGDGVTGGVQPDTALAYAAADPNTGANPTVVDVAYDRNFQGATLTTLFGIDANLNTLVRIGGIDGTPSPNLGEVNTVGGLGLDIGKKVGFDIAADGTAYATLSNANGVYNLYRINLTTGAATKVGKVGNGTPIIMGLAAVSREEIVFATTSTNKLISFKANDPNTLLSSRAITGLNTGETIAGIDFRPLTGQLLALTSTNRVLLIDTNSGVSIVVGTTITTTPQFLAGSPNGFDFNPTVDRLRLVNANNDNLRYNPVTFVPVDSDADGSNGNTPDTSLAYIATDANVGADPNVVAAAYDRNDNDGGTATTLFGIDSTLNILVRQGAVDGNAADVAGGGSPNGGLLTTIGSLGVDPTDLVGFDISGNGSLGNGMALAVMQLQGDTVSKLFAINLTAGLTNQGVGSATLIGTVGGGELITAMAIEPAKIQFSTSSFAATESGGTATITITRTGNSASTATVTFNTSDGSATAGQDYTAVNSLVVSFLAGETTKVVSIPVLVNAGAEAPETVNLALSAVTSTSPTVLGPISSAVLTITE